MAKDNEVFVGRKKELEQFKKVLANPQGQAIIVVGQAGMGKTTLVNKFAEISENYPGLKCGCVRYEIVKEDTTNSKLEMMMDDAFEAAGNPGKFLGLDEHGKKQWALLFKSLKFIPVLGNTVEMTEQIKQLAGSLKREQAKDTRTQFIEKMQYISGKMDDTGRAVFIIDPEKHMHPDSDEGWASVVQRLPEKIKLIFAQRDEDVLVNSDLFTDNDRIVRIPDYRIEKLSDDDVAELVKARESELKSKYSVKKLLEVLKRYDGHPYAIDAAINLVAAGTKLEQLPKEKKPTGFAKPQLEKVRDKEKDAIALFEAYAVLEVAVPDDVAEAVAGIDRHQYQHLTSDKYIKGLLRDESGGKRIYHAILSDYIIEQMGKEEKKEYHRRAVEVYRGKLAKAEAEQAAPDEVATKRLSEHVLEAEGKSAFVEAFVNECYKPLRTLGFLDTAIEMSKRGQDNNNDLRQVTKLRLCEAEILKEKENKGIAVEILHNIDIEMFKENKEEIGLRAWYWDILGDCYHLEDKYPEARDCLEKAIKLWLSISDYMRGVLSTEKLAQIMELMGDLRESERLLEDTQKKAEKAGREDALVPIFWYRRGAVARVLCCFDESEKFYVKCEKLAEKSGDKIKVAYALRGLGEIALLNSDLQKALSYLNGSKKIFEETTHRGRIWIKRFLAEHKRQEALKKHQPDENFKLLMESLSIYCDYICQCCGEIRNPNGTAWGWLSLAFVLLEQRIGTSWDCLRQAEELFRQTSSEIGTLEVRIGKGLAAAVELGKEPDEKVCSELIKTKEYVQKQNIQGKEKLVDAIISYLQNKSGQHIPELLLKELQKPRNPT